MLHEAIFLATCNAMMTNKSRGGVTSLQFSSQLATRNNKQDGRRAKSRRHLAIALLLLAELDNDEDLECNGRERSVWVRPWLAKREERGCFHQVACSCFKECITFLSPSLVRPSSSALSVFFGDFSF